MITFKTLACESSCGTELKSSSRLPTVLLCTTFETRLAVYVLSGIAPSILTLYLLFFVELLSCAVATTPRSHGLLSLRLLPAIFHQRFLLASCAVSSVVPFSPHNRREANLDSVRLQFPPQRAVPYDHVHSRLRPRSHVSELDWFAALVLCIDGS